MEKARAAARVSSFPRLRGGRPAPLLSSFPRLRGGRPAGIQKRLPSLIVLPAHAGIQSPKA